MPRLEFAPNAAPAVESALFAAGFTVEDEHPYVVCVPDTLVLQALAEAFDFEIRPSRRAWPGCAAPRRWAAGAVRARAGRQLRGRSLLRWAPRS